jgi:hypothetical protein
MTLLINQAELVLTGIPGTDRHDISIDIRLLFIIAMEVIDSRPKPGAKKLFRSSSIV